MRADIFRKKKPKWVQLILNFKDMLMHLYIHNSEEFFFFFTKLILNIISRLPIVYKIVISRSILNIFLLIFVGCFVLFFLSVQNSIPVYSIALNTLSLLPYFVSLLLVLILLLVLFLLL
jgi:hypothetical protein